MLRCHPYSVLRMKPGIKTILLTALVAMLVIVGYGGYRAFHAFRMFGVEDQIHGTYFPLVAAIDAYTRENRGAVPFLDDLVPAFIESVPQSDLVNRLEYETYTDFPRWSLSLYSNVHGEERVYTWRSDGEYTAEERERVILRYHGGWVVLEGK